VSCEPGFTHAHRSVLSAAGSNEMAGASRWLEAWAVIGTAVALGFAGYEIKKKGWRNGIVHVGLDITPGIGTIKNVLEIFTGDLIPDKKDAKP